MNITLIGMPACGKSTVGKLLAKKLGMDFLDGDDILRAKAGGKTLQQIIEDIGDEGFREYEDECLASIDVDNTVIAPGGSVCYAKNGVKNLKRLGKVFYLEIPFVEVVKRIEDVRARGITLSGAQTLGDLYEERTPMYRVQCDYVINECGMTAEETADEICKHLN